MVDQKEEIVLELKPSNLKDILLYSLNYKNLEVSINVYPSRFRKILSDYYTYNGITIEGLIDRYSKDYDFYILSNLDKNNNTFKIIKVNEDAEFYGKCENCKCNKKRWVDKETSQCFYKEMITNNYTTKIK